MTDFKTTLRPYPGALLNPTIDPIFKSLFTQNTPTSNGALKAFLSALFNQTVSDIKFMQNELPVESVLDKQSIFDITCTLEDSKQIINIEMQGRNVNDSFDNRSEYYVAHLLNHFVKKGTEWADIPCVYMISVLNFIYDENQKEGFLHYTMKNQNNIPLKSERLHILYLELPKFKKLKDLPSMELTPVQRWAKFFIYANQQEKQSYINELAKADGGIKMAQEALSEISQSDAEWWAETLYLDKVITEKTIKNQAIRKGMAEGLEKGMEKGKKELIKTMLKNGATVEQIVTFTGLSKEEIEKL